MAVVDDHDAVSAVSHGRGADNCLGSTEVEAGGGQSCGRCHLVRCIILLHCVELVLGNCGSEGVKE